MLAGVFAILLVLTLVVMSTLGCVLLTGFWMPKAGHGARVFVAALGGPGVIVVPMILLVLTDAGGDLIAALIGFSFLGAFACAVLGWPVAHFATRRLDRMTRFEVDTFR